MSNIRLFWIKSFNFHQQTTNETAQRNQNQHLKINCFKEDERKFKQWQVLENGITSKKVRVLSK